MIALFISILSSLSKSTYLWISFVFFQGSHDPFPPDVLIGDFGFSCCEVVLINPFYLGLYSKIDKVPAFHLPFLSSSYTYKRFFKSY